MSKMLKPLLLPRLVEERKKRESMTSEMDLSPFYTTPSSSSSEISTPATPTFSTRGHPRLSGSSSSVEAAMQSSPLTDNSQSPTFVAPMSAKRSLPDVQEDPLEREEDYGMEGPDDLYDCLCDTNQCVHRDPSQGMVHSAIQLSTKSDFDFDLVDGFFSDGETEDSPRFKKRRAGDSPLTVLATKFNSRFPTFSRRWRERKGVSALTIVPDQQPEQSGPLISSRSSSVATAFGTGHEPQLPPTPAKSEFDLVDEEGGLGIIDIDKANREGAEPEEGFATTPLLPPLMIDASANSRVVLQSPLESPSVAETSDPFSVVNTPIETTSTPQFSTPHLPGMPSPPLSNKPSISSFHRVTMTRPGHLVPSADIPPIVIADANDEWANKLGHANFTIQPEPYLPEVFDIEACRQFRTSWDLARVNYTKHLVRTGEHYGVTSKTYKLTEEKWAEIDALWKKNNDITIQNTASSSGDAFSTLKQHSFGDPNTVMTKIPSLNDPRSEGKFPQLGDEDIVGPMVQATAHLQRTPSKKAKLMRFFAEKFPALSRTMS